MKKYKYSRIHIFGASGSGTTTLAKKLCSLYNFKHYDTDNYYWLPTDPPYKESRKIEERIQLLDLDLNSNSNWILSGSLCGWGDFTLHYFDLVIFLYIPREIRIQRLKKREYQRYKDDMLPGGKYYEKYGEFINWAKEYDTGDVHVRSLKLHREWMKKITCRLVKIEKCIELDRCVEIVNRVQLIS
jgi:adenylate kinase family enzyme